MTSGNTVRSTTLGRPSLSLTLYICSSAQEAATGLMGPCETKPTEPMVPSGSTYAMASTLWGPNSPQLEKSPVEATRMATSLPFQSSTRIRS